MASSGVGEIMASNGAGEIMEIIARNDSNGGGEIMANKGNNGRASNGSNGGGGVGDGSPETSRLVQVLTSRWLMVFGTILIMAAAGGTYMFGIYSEDMKSALGYDQTTLSVLGFFKDLGANVGVLAGLINELTPPWVVLAIGAVLNFFGYFMIWLAVTKRITTPPLWLMSLFMCIGANSQSFAITGALVTCVKTFPERRGVVLGLLNGFMGLSGAIITQISRAVYGDDYKSFILLIGWLPSAISLAFLRTIRIMRVVRIANELTIFRRVLYTSLGVSGFLTMMIIARQWHKFTQVEYILGAAGLVILLFIPIFMVIKEEFFILKSKKEALHSNSDAATAVPPLIPENSVSDEHVKPNETFTAEEQEVSCWRTAFQPPERGENYTILQALFSVDMLILFLVTICGIGGTLTAINNFGQIGSSFGYTGKSIDTFVSLVSIWNYLGRVVAGSLSEYLLKRYKFPRPMMLTFTLILACLGHLQIAFYIPNGLYVSSVIIGFCFGAQLPIIFAIISELFGLKYYSTLYNFGSLASPIGSYLLSVRVVGRLYDREAEKQLNASGRVRSAGEDLKCHGPECFKMAFIIITAVTLFGALVSVILVLRTKNFYKTDIYKKFRGEEAQVVETEMAGAGNGSIGIPSNSTQT